MSIDIDDVRFRVNSNRWLEIWVGDQELISVDTYDGEISVNPDMPGIGYLVADECGTFEFVPTDEECDDDVMPIELLILKTLERIEQKL